MGLLSSTCAHSDSVASIHTMANVQRSNVRLLKCIKDHNLGKEETPCCHKFVNSKSKSQWRPY